MTRPRHAGDPSVLARALDASAAEISAAAAGVDVASGLAPTWARRPLNAAEMGARVSFLALDEEVERAVSALVSDLSAARARFAALLFEALSAQGSGAAAVLLLQAAELNGLGTFPGAPVLVLEVTRRAADLLGSVGLSAAAGALAEALAQGYEGAMPAHAPGIAGDPQVDQLARRLATAPLLDAVVAAREAVVAAPTFAAAVDTARVAAAAVAGMAPSPLEAYARQAAAQAQGLGRQAGAGVVPPRVIYASEILDRNTCGPCSLVDERSYATLAEARVDYPTGTYRGCQGGLRCRGTLVFLYSSESVPTLQVPGDRPLPGAGNPGGPPWPGSRGVP